MRPTASSRPETVGLYVHWPFCAKKCPYCDFNSHVRETVDQERWRLAMVTELQTLKAQFPNLTIASIFFGGGTPSLMPAETTGAVIDTAVAQWRTVDDLEVTLEANPSSVEADRFRAYRSAGVNRLSVGVQSLRDNALKFLGRLHGVQEAKRALDVAHATFNRVSFDLIYTRPDQSLEAWMRELDEALALAGDHLSLYQLTIEPGTGFEAMVKRGAIVMPDEDTSRQLFDATQARLEAHGMPAYEISNHAKPGAESRHNLIYWQGGAYLGVGPGAHGRTPHPSVGVAQATAQLKKPERWLQAVEDHGWGGDSIDLIDPDTRATERVMMGLRLTSGLDLDALARDLDLSAWETIVNPIAVDDLTDMGLLDRDGSTITFTCEGRPVLNAVIEKLLL